MAQPTEMPLPKIGGNNSDYNSKKFESMSFNFLSSPLLSLPRQS